MATKPYAILLGFAANPDVAIVGELNLRGTVKLYRVIVHRGQLLMHELVRPDDLADVDAIESIDATPAEIERATLLAADMVVPFDPFEYRNLTVERVAELAAAKAAAGEGTATAAEVAAPVKADVADILSLLERSITSRKPAAVAATEEEGTAA
jgi:non-homologous end joining protein Ku